VAAKKEPSILFRLISLNPLDDACGSAGFLQKVAKLKKRTASGHLLGHLALQHQFFLVYFCGTQFLDRTPEVYSPKVNFFHYTFANPIKG
jgi:hypothetical protein